jgi:hypothetical protein
MEKRKHLIFLIALIQKNAVSNQGNQSNQVLTNSFSVVSVLSVPPW